MLNIFGHVCRILCVRQWAMKTGISGTGQMESKILVSLFQPVQIDYVLTVSWVQTSLKSWLFQASLRNCLNCVHNCNDHGLLDYVLIWYSFLSCIFQKVGRTWYLSNSSLHSLPQFILEASVVWRGWAGLHRLHLWGVPCILESWIPPIYCSTNLYEQGNYCSGWIKINNSGNGRKNVYM